MLIEPDGSIRIAWQADGFEAVHVMARFRERAEHEEWARGIADIALFERTFADLRAAIVRAWPGACTIGTRRPAGGAARVVVAFHPPRGEGRPDPY
jgi:hypothetical protein